MNTDEIQKAKQSLRNLFKYWNNREYTDSIIRLDKRERTSNIEGTRTVIKKYTAWLGLNENECVF